MKQIGYFYVYDPNQRSVLLPQTNEPSLVLFATISSKEEYQQIEQQLKSQQRKFFYFTKIIEYFATREEHKIYLGDKVLCHKTIYYR